ncbi:MAG: hypothetical protein R2856_37595 [Caldilineaceae bacterium]
MAPSLYTLSVPRFVLHQVVLPWIIYAGYEQARQADTGGRNNLRCAGAWLCSARW